MDTIYERDENFSTDSSDSQHEDDHDQQANQVKEKKKGKSSNPSSPKRTLMKSRCSCCHICRTSLKNYPRDAMPCSTCNAVVCKTCFRKRMNETWEDALARKDTWICPICDRTCSCVRCLRYNNYTTNAPTWDSSSRPISNAVVGPRKKEEIPQDTPQAPPTVVWKYGDTVTPIPPAATPLPKRKAKKEGSATPKKYGKQKGNSSVPHSPEESLSESNSSSDESDSSVEEEERVYQQGIQERRNMEVLERKFNTEKKERVLRQHSNERFDRSGKSWKQPKRHSLDLNQTRSSGIDTNQNPLHGEMGSMNLQGSNNNNNNNSNSYSNFGARTHSGHHPGRPLPAANYRVVTPDYPYNERITKNFLHSYQSGYVKNQHFDHTTGQESTESSSSPSPSTPLTPTPNYAANPDMSDLLPSYIPLAEEEQMLVSELYPIYPDNFAGISKAMGGSKTPEALSLYFREKKSKEEFKNSTDFGFSLSNSQAITNSSSIEIPSGQLSQVSTPSLGSTDCESNECDSSQCCCALRIPSNETIEKLSQTSASSSCPILSDVIENYTKFATPQPMNLLKLWSNLCLQCEIKRGPS